MYGIRTLLLCVTRGYGYHIPLTSGAALEEERRNQSERAAIIDKTTNKGKEVLAGLNVGWLDFLAKKLQVGDPQGRRTQFFFVPGMRSA